MGTISGTRLYPICIVQKSGLMGPDITLVMSMWLLTAMACSSDLPGGTGPTAVNGSTFQDALYSYCVIFIQSGMLARNLAYGPAGGACWGGKMPCSKKSFKSSASICQSPMTHQLHLRHWFEGWVQYLMGAMQIRMILYTIYGTV